MIVSKYSFLAFFLGIFDYYETSKFDFRREQALAIPAPATSFNSTLCCLYTTFKIGGKDCLVVDNSLIWPELDIGRHLSLPFKKAQKGYRVISATLLNQRLHAAVGKYISLSKL